MTKQLIKALQNFDKTSSEIALVDQKPISDRCSNLYKMHELAKEGLAPKSYKLCNDKGEPVIKRSFINISDEEAWQKDPKRWQQYDYDMSHTKVDEHGNPRKPLTV